ncbi:hypothetical protein ASC63_01795 [Leifsonia sp. Root112D2]|nr:hypothetical protein ASC63_01795 [Leifsonia sp. Root112D2]
MAVMTAATEAWRMASPEDMVRAVSASMRERTGKTVEEWVAIVADAGIDPIDHKAVRNLLKSRWSIPQNSQWAIADAAARSAGWLLRFTDAPTGSRLIPSTNFAQASHRVALSTPEEVDTELRKFIAIAYAQNG